MKKELALAMAFLCLSTGVFAQRKVEVVEKVKVDTNAPAGKVIKRKVAIGRFSNETQYGKGLFYDKENDPKPSIFYHLNWLLLVSSCCSNVAILMPY